MIISSRTRILLLVIILLAAGSLRFYNLMHDSPYFFNPDERNMAVAVIQFKLPSNPSEIIRCVRSELTTHNPQLTTNNCNLNPHFFAYGQFPLYLAFISDQVSKTLIRPIGQIGQISLTTSFDSAVFWLRFYSALTSTLTVLLVYLISGKLISKNYSLITAVFAAFSLGLIQSAHFGTTESLLTFFFLASLYLSISFVQRTIGLWPNLKFIFLTSIVIGLALGSKFTGLFFLVPPGIAILIKIFGLKRKNRKKYLINLLCIKLLGFLIIAGSILFSIFASPYNAIDQRDFWGAVFGYEADVATGKYEAFYTRQFANTTPVLFQMEKIFPYALGWPVFILGSIGILITSLKLFIYIIFSILKKFQIKSKIRISKILKYLDLSHLDLIGILILGFWIYLLPNSFLFAKWTRFMTPVFPFFSIFAGFTFHFLYQLFSGVIDLSQKSKVKSQNYNLKVKRLPYYFYFLTFTFLLLAILSGMAFMSIYTREDTRVQSSKWIYQNIPDNSYILSETANVIDIPVGLQLTNNSQLTTHNYTVISFDFYHMDENPAIYQDLLYQLEKADYIFIPSRRIFANYTRLPSKYPLVTKYYQLLFSGRMGFEKVKEINSFPQLEIGNWKLEINDEQSEESSTVFDHPVIRIYKKIRPMTKEQYGKYLKNDRL